MDELDINALSNHVIRSNTQVELQSALIELYNSLQENPNIQPYLSTFTPSSPFIKSVLASPYPISRISLLLLLESLCLKKQTSTLSASEFGEPNHILDKYNFHNLQIIFPLLILFLTDQDTLVRQQSLKILTHLIRPVVFLLSALTGSAEYIISQLQFRLGVTRGEISSAAVPPSSDSVDRAYNAYASHGGHLLLHNIYELVFILDNLLDHTAVSNRAPALPPKEVESSLPHRYIDNLPSIMFSRFTVSTTERQFALHLLLQLSLFFADPRSDPAISLQGAPLESRTRFRFKWDDWFLYESSQSLEEFEVPRQPTLHSRLSMNQDDEERSIDNYHFVFDEQISQNVQADISLIPYVYQLCPTFALPSARLFWGVTPSQWSPQQHLEYIDGDFNAFDRTNCTALTSIRLSDYCCNVVLRFCRDKLLPKLYSPFTVDIVTQFLFILTVRPKLASPLLLLLQEIVNSVVKARRDDVLRERVVELVSNRVRQIVSSTDALKKPLMDLYHATQKRGSAAQASSSAQASSPHASGGGLPKRIISLREAAKYAHPIQMTTPSNLADLIIFALNNRPNVPQLPLLSDPPEGQRPTAPNHRTPLPLYYARDATNKMYTSHQFYQFLRKHPNPAAQYRRTLSSARVLVKAPPPHVPIPLNRKECLFLLRHSVARLLSHHTLSHLQKTGDLPVLYSLVSKFIVHPLAVGYRSDADYPEHSQQLLTGLVTKTGPSDGDSKPMSENSGAMPALEFDLSAAADDSSNASKRKRPSSSTDDDNNDAMDHDPSSFLPDVSIELDTEVQAKRTKVDIIKHTTLLGLFQQYPLKCQQSFAVSQRHPLLSGTSHLVPFSGAMGVFLGNPYHRTDFLVEMLFNIYRSECMDPIGLYEHATQSSHTIRSLIQEASAPAAPHRKVEQDADSIEGEQREEDDTHQNERYQQVQSLLVVLQQPPKCNMPWLIETLKQRGSDLANALLEDNEQIPWDTGYLSEESRDVILYTTPLPDRTPNARRLLQTTSPLASQILSPGHLEHGKEYVVPNIYQVLNAGVDADDSADTQSQDMSDAPHPSLTAQRYQFLQWIGWLQAMQYDRLSLHKGPVSGAPSSASTIESSYATPNKPSSSSSSSNDVSIQFPYISSVHRHYTPMRRAMQRSNPTGLASIPEMPEGTPAPSSNSSSRHSRVPSFMKSTSAIASFVTPIKSTPIAPSSLFSTNHGAQDTTTTTTTASSGDKQSTHPFSYLFPLAKLSLPLFSPKSPIVQSVSLHSLFPKPIATNYSAASILRSETMVRLQHLAISKFPIYDRYALQGLISLFDGTPAVSSSQSDDSGDLAPEQGEDSTKRQLTPAAIKCRAIISFISNLPIITHNILTLLYIAALSTDPVVADISLLALVRLIQSRPTTRAPALLLIISLSLTPHSEIYEKAMNYLIGICYPHAVSVAHHTAGTETNPQKDKAAETSTHNGQMINTHGAIPTTAPVLQLDNYGQIDVSFSHLLAASIRRRVQRYTLSRMDVLLDPLYPYNSPISHYSPAYLDFLRRVKKYQQLEAHYQARNVASTQGGSDGSTTPAKKQPSEYQHVLEKLEAQHAILENQRKAHAEVHETSMNQRAAHVNRDLEFIFALCRYDMALVPHLIKMYNEAVDYESLLQETSSLYHEKWEQNRSVASDFNPEVYLQQTHHQLALRRCVLIQEKILLFIQQMLHLPSKSSKSAFPVEQFLPILVANATPSTIVLILHALDIIFTLRSAAEPHLEIDQDTLLSSPDLLVTCDGLPQYLSHIDQLYSITRDIRVYIPCISMMALPQVLRILPIMLTITDTMQRCYAFKRLFACKNAPFKLLSSNGDILIMLLSLNLSRRKDSITTAEHPHDPEENLLEISQIFVDYPPHQNTDFPILDSPGQQQVAIRSMIVYLLRQSSHFPFSTILSTLDRIFQLTTRDLLSVPRQGIPPPPPPPPPGGAAPPSAPQPAILGDHSHPHHPSLRAVGIQPGGNPPLSTKQPGQTDLPQPQDELLTQHRRQGASFDGLSVGFPRHLFHLLFIVSLLYPAELQQLSFATTPPSTHLLTILSQVWAVRYDRYIDDPITRNDVLFLIHHLKTIGYSLLVRLPWKVVRSALVTPIAEVKKSIDHANQLSTDSGDRSAASHEQDHVADTLPQESTQASMSADGPAPSQSEQPTVVDSQEFAKFLHLFYTTRNTPQFAVFASTVPHAAMKHFIQNQPRYVTSFHLDIPIDQVAQSNQGRRSRSQKQSQPPSDGSGHQSQKRGRLG